MKKLIIALIALGLFGCESPGRYQLVQGKTTYLVDTKTGRVWEQEKELGDPLNSFYPKSIIDKKGVPNWKP